MTTTPDAALALADDCATHAKSCDHRGGKLAASLLRLAAAALRDLADAAQERDRLAERVQELEEKLVWWQDSEAEMRRQRDRLKKLFSWLVERQIKKERALERRHAAELFDMRAMVRGYRAASGEGEAP